jgi:hypothetical protein
VAVISTDDSFGTDIVEATKFRIIDEALKLEAIELGGIALIEVLKQ